MGLRVSRRNSFTGTFWMLIFFDGQHHSRQRRAISFLKIFCGWLLSNMRSKPGISGHPSFVLVENGRAASPDPKRRFPSQEGLRALTSDGAAQGPPYQKRQPSVRRVTSVIPNSRRYSP